MYDKNYIRKYQLYIGYPENYKVADPVDIKEDSVSKVKEGSAPEFMSTPSKGKGILIEDLRVHCSVGASSETSGSDARKGKVKIYNANGNTRNILSQKNINVIFKAGYKDAYDQDSLPIVISGQVSSVKFERQGTDVVTVLNISDGYVPHTSAKINHNIVANYLNPISGRTVLEFLVEAWRVNGISSDLSTVEYDFLLDSVKYYAGWIGTGYLKDVMDKFCEDIGMTWYIVNSTLYVQRRDSTKFTEKFTPDAVISLDPIVNPVRSSSEVVDKSRVKICLFLDGRIKEGSFVDISKEVLRNDKENLVGIYKVKKVEHEFDSYQGVAKTTVEAEKS